MKRACIAFAALGVLGTAEAQEPHGGDFFIEQGRTGPAGHVRMAAEGPAATFVVWHHPRANGLAIRGRRYATDLPDRPFDLAAGTAGAPAIGCNDRGVCVVVWQDARGCMTGRHFEGGSPDLAFRDCDAVVRAPAVAVSPSGSWMVVGESWGNHWDILGRIYAADGTPGIPFWVNLGTESYQQGPAVAAAPSGEFWVVWHSFSQPGNPVYGIRARIVDAGGAGGDEIPVNQTRDADQKEPAIAISADGTALITWNSCCQAPGFRIYARAFDGAGEPLGPEWMVSKTVVPYPDGYFMRSAVTAGQWDGFVVVWEEGAADLRDIQARRIRADGSMGPVVPVNETTDHDQGDPSVAPTPGGFLAGWTSTIRNPSSAVGRRFKP